MMKPSGIQFSEPQRGERIFMWKKAIDWLDWNDVRNTYPTWLWVANGAVIVMALLVIIFV